MVISEKATVAGILRPVLEKYGVPFMALHGYNSATKVYELAQEIQCDQRDQIFLWGLLSIRRESSTIQSHDINPSSLACVSKRDIFWVFLVAMESM